MSSGLSPWIPSELELPENHPGMKVYDDGRMQLITVIAYCEGRGPHIRNRLNIRKCGNAYLDAQATNGWEWSFGVETPSHWMPLPENPQKETEEQG